MTKNDLHKKDKVYYAQIMPNLDVFEVCELIVRTIEDNYFVGIDKTNKHAHLIPYSKFGELVFINRAECLEKVLLEEERKKVKPDELFNKKL